MRLHSWALALLFLTAPVAAQAQPAFTMTFTPDTIGPGSASRLVYRINNTAQPNATGLAFTHNLGPNVTVANPANVTTDCVEATVAAPDGGTAVTLSDGRIGSGAQCTIEVSVTSSTFATHTETTGDLTSSTGNSGTATDDLTVTSALPGFSVSAAPSAIRFGTTTTLTYTIDNTANASRVGNLDFTHALPLGVTVASPSNASTDCVSASAPDTLIVAESGSGVIMLNADGTTILPGFEVLPAAATCTVTVDVAGGTSGVLPLETEPLLADFTAAGFATAPLTVDPVERVHLFAEFIDDPVPPGGSTVLEFTLFNFDRDNAATDIAFTNDLSMALAGLTLATVPMTEPCGPGSAATGEGTEILDFSAGSLAPESGCTFSVTVDVPAGATPGLYLNATGMVSATVDSSPMTLAGTTNDLFVQEVPIVTLEFLEVGTLSTNPLVGAGTDVVMRTTITNTSLASSAVDIAVNTELTGILPFPLTVVLPPVPDPPCGGGSNLGFTFPDTDRQALSLTGGTLAASPGMGSSCTWDVTVSIPVGQPAGAYTVITSNPVTTVSGSMVTGEPASAVLEIVGTPHLTHEFVPELSNVGTTVTVQYTLEHSATAVSDATNVSFTHDFNAIVPGMAAVMVPGTDLCGPGNGSYDSSTNPLAVSGITLIPGQTCTFTVDVLIPAAATAGTFTSTTSEVSADTAGTTATGFASSFQFGIAGVQFNSEFLPDTSLPGASVTLRYTFENTHPTDNATGAFFTSFLNENLTGLAATGAPTMDTCGGSLSGTTTLTYVGASIPSGSTCTIEVPVQVPPGAPFGQFTVRTSSPVLTLGAGMVIARPASTTITVADPLFASKVFAEGRSTPGGTVTLEYQLVNADPANSVTNIAFTEDLDAALTGMAAVGNPSVDPCTGGMLSGAGVLSFSGGTLGPSETCTISVTVTLPTDFVGEVTTVTSTITGTVGGLPSSATGPTAVLPIDGVLLSHDFGPALNHGGTGSVSYTLESVDAAGTLSNLRLAHDLDSVLAGMTVSGLPQADVCGAGSVLSGDALGIQLTGAILPPLATCNFSVDYLVPDTTVVGDYPSTVGPVTQDGVPFSGVSSDTLTVTVPAPEFSVAFNPATIVTDEFSTLSLTVDNSAGNGDVANLTSSATLPPGIVLSATPNFATDCGGAFTANGNGYSLAGGTVAANSTCSATVEVTSSTAGVYTFAPPELTSIAGSSAPQGTVDLTVLGRDTDGDGVLDSLDTDISNPNVCQDTDADGCDDCSNTGADGSGGDATNDGTDLDADGLCNVGDTDDDGDGVHRPEDLDDTTPTICRDADGDTCDDCANTAADGSGGDPSNDGADEDSDGICDASDPDFEDGESDKKSGCSSLQGTGPLFALPVVLILWRRRREGR